MAGPTDCDPKDSVPAPHGSPTARVLVLCESIHAVLAVERALRAAAVPCDLVPVPRELASDCGLCVTLDAGALGRARPVLLASRTRTRGIFAAESGGFRPVRL